MNYIQKCTGINCPIKMKCYRFIIPSNPEPNQKWLPNVPYNQEKNKCSKFYGDGMMKINKPESNG